MNGIIKIISKKRYRAKPVLENRYASGAAITVETITTSTPRSREFPIISRFPSAFNVCHTDKKSRRPSTMTALAKIMTSGQTIINKSRAVNKISGICFLKLSAFISSPHQPQISLILAAESEAIFIILSQSHSICGMSERLVRLSVVISVRPGRR